MTILDINNLQTVISFQVFISNTNNLQPIILWQSQFNNKCIFSHFKQVNTSYLTAIYFKSQCINVVQRHFTLSQTVLPF